MIHAICDFCGKEAQGRPVLLSMTPFFGFAREHTDTKPYGVEEKTKSFVICCVCREKHNLPNPYETYSGVTAQEVKYEKTLDSYTYKDLLADDERDEKS